ncbi:MAG: tetratricopeptide repeat protein [Cyclobacteriaceae bacterium]
MRKVLIDVYDGVLRLDNDSIQTVAQHLQQNSDDQYSLALSNYYIANHKNSLNDLRAASHYIEAIHQLEEADTLDVFLELSLRKNLGVIFKQNGDLESGLRYYLEALPFAEAYDKTRPFEKQTNVMSLKYNIANAYSANYNPKAVDIYLEILNEAKKKNDTKKIAQINNQLGDLFQKAEEYGLAINHFKSILDISDKLDDPKLEMYLGFANQNIGEVYFEQNRFDLAEKHLLRSLDYYSNDRKFGAMVELAELYIRIGKKAEAKSIGDQALDIYPSVQKTKEGLRIFELMASLISTEEEKSNVYITRLLAEQQLLNEERSQLTDLKDKENLYRVVDSYYKELEANQRKSEYRQWIITGCAILVSLIALVAIYFMIMDKRKKQELSDIAEDDSSDFKYY